MDLKAYPIDGNVSSFEDSFVVFFVFVFGFFFFWLGLLIGLFVWICISLSNGGVEYFDVVQDVSEWRRSNCGEEVELFFNFFCALLFFSS